MVGEDEVVCGWCGVVIDKRMKAGDGMRGWGDEIVGVGGGGWNVGSVEGMDLGWKK